MPKDLKNTVMSLPEEKKMPRAIYGNTAYLNILAGGQRNHQLGFNWTILAVNPTHTFRLKVQEVIITIRLQLEAWF